MLNAFKALSLSCSKVNMFGINVTGLIRGRCKTSLFQKLAGAVNSTLVGATSTQTTELAPLDNQSYSHDGVHPTYPITWYN